MENFSVLTLGEFITGEESLISILAFAEFYFSVTSKHQKRSKFTIIEKPKYIPSIKEKIKQYDIESICEIIELNDQAKVKEIYNSASIFLLPTFQKVDSVFAEALSFGLPILSYDHPKHEDYVDRTCGMVVQHISKEQSIQAFGKMLHILYFDPAARKILSRGAEMKHEKEFSWGGRRQNR